MQNFHSFVHFSYSIPDVSAGRIARELWWTSQEFNPDGIIITMTPRSHITQGTNNRPVGGRGFETYVSPYRHDQSINHSSAEANCMLFQMTL
jgi:hypothetical protein